VRKVFYINENFLAGQPSQSNQKGRSAIKLIEPELRLSFPGQMTWKESEINGKLYDSCSGRSIKIEN